MQNMQVLLSSSVTSSKFAQTYHLHYFYHPEWMNEVIIHPRSSDGGDIIPE